MNRKVMRKSTLISSIAMLLVAVLALSGVTFAWFSSNPMATAGTLTMHSTAINGVYIAETELSDRTEPTVWSMELDWNSINQKLGPVSCAFQNNTANFFATTSNKTDGTWDGETAITEASAESYIAKRIWVKADVGSATANLMLTVDFNGLQERGYQRFAIINVTDGNTVVFASDERTTNAFINTDGETAEVTTTAAAESGNILIEGYKGEVKEFVVYFFFEGQDPDCTTAKSYSNVTVDLSFEVKEPATAEG